jgi:UDP-N-acetylglucosamine 4,6-dehydratase (inverting)
MSILDLDQQPPFLSEQDSILVTGGTGSFGKAFIHEILTRHPKVRRIVVYSRDELKQYEMQEVFPATKYPQLRFFIGDVRDAQRLLRAMEGISVVVHAAALKQVPAAEYNPFECIQTNVIGAQNVIEACLDSGVKRVVALSTDKAAAPVNLYGATKLCSDKLFVAANNIKGKRDIRFSVVRYGNVMGSRGSVIPFFLSKRGTGKLPVTDAGMTRFNITLREGVSMVSWALSSAVGGEILVPKIPSYRILDVVKAVDPSAEIVIVGIRPGEKLHEEMITQSDAQNVVDLGDHFALLPSGNDSIRANYDARKGAKSVALDFSYSSGTNPEFLTPQQIRDLIVANLNVKV